MKGLITLLFFIILAIRANACDIESYSHIVLLSDNETSFGPLIKQSDCTPDVRNAFTKALASLSGKAGADQIVEMMGKTEVKISPSSITVDPIHNLLKDKLELPFEFAFQKFQLTGTEKHLLLSTGDFIHVECAQCDSPGSKTLKLTIANPLSGTERVRWGTAKLMKRISVLRALQQITPSQGALSASLVEEAPLLVESPDSYFTNADALRFFRPNRSIAKDSIIKTSDLIPAQIVKAGSMAKVRIQQGDLMLESTALARNSASYGQDVELVQPKTNKRMTGKAIDFNTVKIEL